MRIPFIPRPYPDETLASWMARVVMRNGSGTWRTLLESAGYGRRTLSPFVSIPDPDPRLDRLLEALGTSYSDVLHQLTELPFWLAFNGPSLSTNPVRILGGNKTATSLMTLGKPRGALSLSGARFCRECLVADTASVGEPYYHRSHQLPVSLVCAAHGCFLQVACEHCETIVAPYLKRLLPPLSLRCQCGQRLAGSDPQMLPARPALRDLAQFATQVLHYGTPSWTRDQALSLLRTTAAEGAKPGRFTGDARAVLHEAYGDWDERQGLRILRVNSEIGVFLRLRTTVACFRAPEFCALFTAMGWTFEQVGDAARSCDPLLRHEGQPAAAISLERARMEFTRLHKAQPTSACSAMSLQCPQLYWLLRLRDAGWMHSIAGRSLGVPLPSVAEDRQAVMARFASKSPTARQFEKVGPWIRAGLRDSEWCDGVVREVAAARKVRAAERRRQLRLEQENAVSRALFTALRNEKRPQRMHAGLLAPIAGLTMSRTQDVIAKCPRLLELIRRINERKTRRAVMWAAKDLLEEGSQLVPIAIIRHARLVTTQKNRLLAEAAIEALRRSP